MTATNRIGVDPPPVDEDFESVLRGHDPRLRRYAYRIVGDDVDDVLQDAYLKAFRARTGFRGEASLSTWLYRIVHNSCMTHVQRQKALYSRRDQPTVIVNPTSVGSRVAGRIDLASALDRLPTDQRAAILLICLDGMSYEEASQILDAPVGTLASRVNRGRSALRQLLENGESS